MKTGVSPETDSQPHRYEYQVNLENTNAAASNVVAFVGRDKRVLEIGSGPGSITRALREAGGCRIVAIEIDEDAARRVAPYCEDVFQVDLNRAGWGAQVSGQGKFDAVVAADVLEHLVDPWATLREMIGVLAPGGAIVVSLPHAGHNAVIASLINGDVAYARHGLLDRTHIRFFGIHNIQALFNDAGLAIVDAHFVSRPPLLTELSEQWQRLPAGTRATLDGNPYGGIYQVVVKAVISNGAVGGLQLAQLTAPDPRGTFFQRTAGPVWSRLSRNLSPAARDRVKRWVKKAGIGV
jgi:2-polyprenyl-3-methyl-5-hydroxy-6-metoxy-1,4-benzoquinol methylase